MSDWRDTKAGIASYRAARATAQASANLSGSDYGIEVNHVLKEFMVYRLPQTKNRFGHELRCEVVSCEDLAKRSPGHGPSSPVLP